MGIDPISSEESSVSIDLVKLRRKGRTSELIPETYNGWFTGNDVVEECDLSHLTKEQLKNLLDSAYPKITTPAREIHLTTAYRGKAHQQFIEVMASECAKKTLHYQQMDPNYMFPYDAEGVKQKLLEISSDQVKGISKAIRKLTRKKIRNEEV